MPIGQFCWSDTSWYSISAFGLLKVSLKRKPAELHDELLWQTGNRGSWTSWKVTVRFVPLNCRVIKNLTEQRLTADGNFWGNLSFRVFKVGFFFVSFGKQMVLDLAISRSLEVRRLRVLNGPCSEIFRFFFNHLDGLYICYLVTCPPTFSKSFQW